MPKGFTNYHSHVGRPEEGVAGPESLVSRSAANLMGMAADTGEDLGQHTFENDETAARYYLDQMFAPAGALEAARGLAAAVPAEAAPNLRMRSIQEQPLTNTRVVRFQQEQDRIPVFGSHAIVELDQNRNFISMDADMAEIRGVSPIAKLSPAQALRRIRTLTGQKAKALAGVQAPELNFFHDDKTDTWHLAWFFKNVPAAPPDFVKEAVEDEEAGFGHGLGISPRLEHPEINYLVDAHDGSILYYYSAHPLLDVPAKCRGLDEEGMAQAFFGRQVQGGFALDDPLRAIRTYDLNFGDIEKAKLPDAPATNGLSDWAAVNRAAISAHVNATRVYDFYKSELKRDGIDDKGMVLVSIVNCTYPRLQPPPQWFNAVWFQDRMWYGQIPDNTGQLRSFARFLDVIGHELTHGVTETTAALVYRDQSGALNESFSDIFGVIIRNWYEVGPDSDVSKWNWEIGSGLGRNGQPLRDMQDPTRVGDPAHMKDFLNTVRDNGGVHTNSNIHNKAAYNVLTAGDEQGRVFPPREVAILYYLTLTRLGSLADFSKVLQVLVDVASTFYVGDQAEKDRKIKAIKAAYEAVGIQ